MSSPFTAYSGTGGASEKAHTLPPLNLTKLPSAPAPASQNGSIGGRQASLLSQTANRGSNLPIGQGAGEETARGFLPQKFYEDASRDGRTAALGGNAFGVHRPNATRPGHGGSRRQRENGRGNGIYGADRPVTPLGQDLVEGVLPRGARVRNPHSIRNVLKGAREEVDLEPTGLRRTKNSSDLGKVGDEELYATPRGATPRPGAQVGKQVDLDSLLEPEEESPRDPQGLERALLDVRDVLMTVAEESRGDEEYSSFATRQLSQILFPVPVRLEVKESFDLEALAHVLKKGESKELSTAEFYYLMYGDALKGVDHDVTTTLRDPFVTTQYFTEMSMRLKSSHHKSLKRLGELMESFVYQARALLLCENLATINNLDCERDASPWTSYCIAKAGSMRPFQVLGQMRGPTSTPMSVLYEVKPGVDDQFRTFTIYTPRGTIEFTNVLHEQLLQPQLWDSLFKTGFSKEMLVDINDTGKLLDYFKNLLKTRTVGKSNYKIPPKADLVVEEMPHWPLRRWLTASIGEDKVYPFLYRKHIKDLARLIKDHGTEAELRPLILAGIARLARQQKALKNRFMVNDPEAWRVIQGYHPNSMTLIKAFRKTS